MFFISYCIPDFSFKGCYKIHNVNFGLPQHDSNKPGLKANTRPVSAV